MSVSYEFRCTHFILSAFRMNIWLTETRMCANRPYCERPHIDSGSINRREAQECAVASCSSAFDVSLRSSATPCVTHSMKYIVTTSDTVSQTGWGHRLSGASAAYSWMDTTVEATKIYVRHADYFSKPMKYPLRERATALRSRSWFLERYKTFHLLDCNCHPARVVLK